MKPVTVESLQHYKSEQKKFSCIAAYDALFARLINQAEIDVILVGDSLGMVLQGNDSTVAVTIEQMQYHTRSVARGNSHSLVMADMPFMTYASKETAINHATTLMQSGAHIIKLEGGQWLTETISTLVCGGIPVCAHIGLTPQSVNTLGGYKVQGRSDKQANQLVDDAIALEAAGAQVLLMECVPSHVAKRVDQAITIPTIGIGAGSDTTGQVLVLHDMLGLNSRPAKFVKNFMASAESIQQALENFNTEVKSCAFPEAQHSFK